jgi:hypothetical protein
MQTNKGYKLPENIINELGNFDQVITSYNPEIVFIGRVLAHCMKKEDEAIIELMYNHKSGLLCVYSRAETIQFQRLLETAHSVLLIKGRVRFKDVKYDLVIASNAPHGTAIFSFTNSDTVALQRSGLNGKVIYLRQPDIALFPEKNERYIEHVSDPAQ